MIYSVYCNIEVLFFVLILASFCDRDRGTLTLFIGEICFVFENYVSFIPV